MAKISRQGRRKSRYWLRCADCKAPQLFKEWSWEWDAKAIRNCAVCSGIMKRANDAAALNLAFPKKRRKRPSYREYLASDLWKTIRARVLKRDNETCCCGNRATQVHHREYSPAVMTGHNDAMLVSLCKPCHDWITYRPDGGKRDWRSTERLLQELQSPISHIRR